MELRIHKYHALGNDYLILDPAEESTLLSPTRIQRICDRHRGAGSDGLLWGPLPGQEGADFGLRLFNPDGGEFEISGNGLRIFCRYLYDRGLVTHLPFMVHTPAGVVRAQVLDAGQRVTVDMGRVSFHSHEIPVLGPEREVLDEEMAIQGQTVRYSAATVGNPHCVVLREQVSPEQARALGPYIEHEPRFPNRTNVQFMVPLAQDRIRIEIWERGAGYTLASGSSSCAAAAVAHRLGFCGQAITVVMAGGEIQIELRKVDGLRAQMTGTVTRVYSAELDPEGLALGGWDSG
jgi:diaminopimelate epimerase